MKLIFSYRIFLFLFFFFLFCIPQAQSEDYSASYEPWSGYWWPFSKGGLATGIDYRSHPAPLEKYELLLNGAYPGSLTSWYKTRFYDNEAPGWYGLCANWAQASSYEQIEILPSSENNIIFRVGDKKGLLTLAHNNNYTEVADGSSPDIFHYWLLNYIKDQGKAFVADLDPGVEIWSYPIYRYIMDSSINGNIEFVTVTIFYADDMVDPDYMGTKVMKKTYTYNLFLTDNTSIYSGEWIGESVNDHPERLTFTIMPNNDCPYLDYEEVLRLANSSDDFLETSDKIVNISPGTYNLILMNEDIYNINCTSGDIVSVQVEKADGSLEDMRVIITDGEGYEIENKIIYTPVPNSEAENIHKVFIADNPPYTISITQNNYSDPNIYTIKIDLQKKYIRNIPYVPKNSMWSGFALTNSDEIDAEGLMLTTYTDKGEPIQTLLGPLTMLPGEYRLFLFEDLPWRKHEYAESDKLILNADKPVHFVNCIGGDDGDFMTSFIQSRLRWGKHLIIPDTAPLKLNNNQRMFGEVHNTSFEDALVSLYLYSQDGNLLSEKYETIAPRERIYLRSGSEFFYNMPDSGWIEIIGDTGQALNGYQFLSADRRAESLFALSVNSSKKIVPHIPPPIGYWTVNATLINPNNTENTVNFHMKMAENHDEDLNITLGPNEKRVINLQEQFGKMEEDSLSHSIIEITGEYTLAGYYTYKSPSGGDEASLPFLDETDWKKELILPHYAGREGYWWTGIGLLNPSLSPVTVKAMPYGDNGILEQHIKYLDIDPGYCEVFTIKSFFTDIASEVFFVKFNVEDQINIGGYYLYGNDKNGTLGSDMFSGANM